MKGRKWQYKVSKLYCPCDKAERCVRIGCEHNLTSRDKYSYLVLIVKTRP